MSVVNEGPTMYAGFKNDEEYSIAFDVLENAYRKALDALL